MFKRLCFIISAFLLSVNSFSQKVLSPDEAVTLILKNSGSTAAAGLNMKQQQQLLKTAVNLPNPEFFMEAPTGNFYTPSITQSIEFPTVYSRQYQLQKQNITLAAKEKILTESEIKFQVLSIYLSFQYSDSLYRQLLQQDSIYNNIRTIAARQFDAGQIDYLQKTFAETQYGEVHNQLLQTKASFDGLQNQLQYLTHIIEPIQPEPLKVNDTYQLLAELAADTALLQNSPQVQVYKQVENINSKNIQLQKSKALPGLALGYLNQGERSTPTGNRFRFGLTLPLWFWQYKGSIDAAKTGYEVSRQNTLGLQQQLNTRLIEAQNSFIANRQSVTYYSATGIKQADEIIKTAQRFLISGQTDYISYLRNVNDAYTIKLKYIEAIKNYNQSIFTIQYLTGSL